jgi:positive regulator of sigma E activity
MSYLHSTLFFAHIFFGTVALILFWVPIFTKKGQLNHKKFGRAYRNVMYAVAGSGSAMALIVIALPLVIKPQLANAENVEQAVQNVRYFWLFLLYLGLLSFTTTRHGDAVLKAGNDRSNLRKFSYVAPLFMLAISGLVFIVIGRQFEQTLHLLFGILGCAVGISMLRYVFKLQAPKNGYLLEHIGSMIGSGIGAYTAFFAFGGRHLLEGIGGFQLIFWIAPGVLGSIFSFYLTRKYRKVFQIAKEEIV